MEAALKYVAKDVNISDLTPLNVRGIDLNTNIKFKKIISSIKNFGLIEPLSVFKGNGSTYILDGFLRYKACEMLKIEKVPCLFSRNKEAYTYNRMVNRLSPVQENRMLKKALEVVDEKTIARVFEIKSMNYHLTKSLLEQLHPEIIKIFDKDMIRRRTAEEFTYVKPMRQLEILKEMEAHNNYSHTFVRALILKTPKELRNTRKKTKEPWGNEGARKYELVDKLQKAEEDYDFYDSLYRKYSTDLIKLCIYIRKFIINKEISAYLSQKYPNILETFKKIISQTQPETVRG